jgi:ATP-dependent helicase/nuclease subunit A
MEADPVKPLNALTSAQREAVVPDRDVWLSASAGTGKTQVLTARVIRLLLEDGVRPQNLLCLTFTKAAAAEMAERINQRLASWVQMPLDRLHHELEAIGAISNVAAHTRARKLFARVLDAPGGGLQIMTIHAFCQSLLASFPEEAGLLPGFEPIEGRLEEELLDEALESLIAAAAEPGREWILENIRQLSLDLGEGDAVAFLRRCAKQPDAMAYVPHDKGALALARIYCGVQSEGETEATLAARLEDSAINLAMLRAISDANRDWKKKTGDERVAAISDWLAASPEQRVDTFASLHGCWATNDNKLRAKGPKGDSYQELINTAFIWSRHEIDYQNRARFADRLAASWLAGKAYAESYAELKHQRGLVDFNDLIVRAADLLGRPGMGEWVRYKLDQRIDHVLVDEAQDTNDAQWAIIEALTGDFYSGAGAGSERPRTIFSVGDFKQAIYGFQGTDPQKYSDAADRFAAKIGNAEKQLHRLSLSQSFRSSMPVLQFVDAVADAVGHENFGLTEPIERHLSEKGDVGSVTMLPTVSADTDYEDGDEDWLGEDKRILAAIIADHVKKLVDDRPLLAVTGKQLVPGDIMILLRSRTELAGLIVARLHAHGVAVAGIDRLKISEPIAVQDMLSAIRFVLQPDDDLSLACLLVSPLIGWTQDQLLTHGYRDKRMPLWQHLRTQPDIAADIAPLYDLLDKTDLVTPFAFLEKILTGAMRGRQKFLARLGSETLVPIEEFLNLAHRYRRSSTGLKKVAKSSSAKGWLRAVTSVL